MTLQTEKLGYWYQTESEALFREVDLTFDSGKMYAILGSSGSGKTTFLSLITGLDTPKEGNIYYDNEPLNKIDCENTVVKMFLSSFKLIICCPICRHWIM